MLRLCLFGSLLMVTACGSDRITPGTGFADSAECAPFARQVSGIALFGDAASWWDQAEGQYAKSSAPVAAGVLVFRRSQRLPFGHVSVVTRLVSDREIRVTQANWVHGRITRDEPVLDVSPDNDWSLVRVWWEPARSLGSTMYGAYGFVLPARARPRGELVTGLMTP